MIKSLFIKSFFSSIKFCQKKTLNANAKEYFDVVSDVANYKLFLPWCSQSQIISKHNKENFDAKLTINFKVYKASYISKVSIDKERDSYRIISNIKENDPIFSNLMSKWKITYLNEKQCQITYDVEFEFRNLLYQQASQYFICIIGEKMTNAFEKRVNEENLKKNKNSQKHNETKKKSLNLLPTSDILESLIEKIHYFYKLNKISQYDFEVIIEIIDQNLDFKELLVQAYILFCKNNHNYKDGDNKLLHYLKDISLMNKIIIVN